MRTANVSCPYNPKKKFLPSSLEQGLENSLIVQPNALVERVDAVPDVAGEVPAVGQAHAA